ncbi:hypothetical protein M2480_001210 [Parabacteroides sp. PFB2-12]|nr:hypothetical protein [Parabacteroides sp. PM6-13]MDH6390240.1 hypothetical protein [Parabacteroides sp. PFB2-12]
MLSLSKGPILNKTQGVFTTEVSSGKLSGSIYRAAFLFYGSLYHRHLLFNG